MTREVINPPELPAVNPTYSQAIRANGFVYVAGQAIENTATVLRAAGSSLENVVSTTLYLTEFDQLGKVNAVYAEYFPKAGPAKLSCGVSALYGGAKFEIQAIAVMGRT